MLSNIAVFAEEGKEGSMLLREWAVSSSKHSTGSRELARKKKSIGWQETIDLGCQGCWLLHELLQAELDANRSGHVPPTAGKTDGKRAGVSCNSPGGSPNHQTEGTSEIPPTTCGALRHCCQIPGGVKQMKI